MKRTPLYNFQKDQGGQMVDYAGWEMPIRFGSIIDEHKAVREKIGIFDVSHMGRVEFKGRHARRFLERVCTRKLSNMKVNTCRYSLVCNEKGGVLDDVIIYRFDSYWLMVCNASNREKLLGHFDAVMEDMAVKITDMTEKTAMVAVQGPGAMEFIGKFSKEIPELKRYTFTTKNMLILKLIVSRTGYTGEDGVEIILGANMVNMAMKLLMKNDESGAPSMTPCGLGCRDSLRLEAGMPLYGHELSEELDPLSAGLGFAVSLDKDEDESFGEPVSFIGQEALKKIAAEGVKRKLVGLKLEGKRTPRQAMVVKDGDAVIGEVTSGCLSPTLGCPIAMAYVDVAKSEVGGKVQIDFGKQVIDAEVVALPFYKKG